MASEPLTVRFAILGGGGREAWPFGRDAQDQERAALLISYFFVADFDKNRDQYHEFSDFALDSGAYSAKSVGAKINLDSYIDYSQDRLSRDPQLTEVFALDVIGDWRASLRNTERMWEAGVPAIPTYHMGEPAHVLRELAATYPKIALGGAVGVTTKRKLAWAEACFAQVWPKPIHGLGFGSPESIMALPWHSLDATNWILGPARFGRWRSMPGGFRYGNDQAFRMEVDHYLAFQRRARARWRKELAMIDQMMAEA